MKMIPIKRMTQFWYLIFFILLFFELTQGQTCVEGKNDSLIQSGIKFSIQHDYHQAEAIFQQIIEDYPDHPIGYFFMAATIQSKMMDYESDQWNQDFYRYIQLAIHYAKNNRLDEKKDNIPWTMFYHGSALCYLAFHEGRNGDYFKAIHHGLSGISILNQITKRHPEFYDAYFGIGSYKYWRSQKTKFLNWLPILSDERQEGIAMVQQAVEKGTYTRYAAINELIWILLDSGRADRAYSWALKGLEKFPQSRFFLWGAAKSAFALDDHSNAAIHFQQLLTSIMNTPCDNYYNEFICRVKLAQCYAKLGKYSAASCQIGILHSLPLSPELEKRLKKQQKQLSRLKKKLSFVASLSF